MKVPLALRFLDFLLSLSCLSLHFSESEVQLKTYRRGCDFEKRIWEVQKAIEKVSDLEKVGYLSLSATVGRIVVCL